jgi:glycosyltransferase involved in cell wall biosynthesis
MSSVAIIIPCHNHGAFVGEAVASALAQTRHAAEILLIDDASDEATREACEKLASTKIRLIRNETNLGLAASRNKAIWAAESELILPLDADDRLHPEYLEKTIPVIESSSEIGWVYTDCAFFGAREGFLDFPDYDLKLLLAHDLCLAPSLFRKRDWERVGGYDESFKIGQEDWDFWLSLAGAGLRGEHVRARLYDYRQHPESMRSRSHRDLDVAARKLWNKHRKLYEKHAEEIWRYYVARFYGGLKDPFHAGAPAGMAKRIYKKIGRLLKID